MLLQPRVLGALQPLLVGALQPLQPLLVGALTRAASCAAASPDSAETKRRSLLHSKSQGADGF
jgi:hypothetical protein